MKRILLIVGLVGGMTASRLFAAFDGTVTMGWGDYHASSGVGVNGGEFSAATTGVSKPGLGSFLTFCVEDNEYFKIGGTYDYFENSGAVLGGISGQDATDPHTGASMDNISLGTAWLYSQFRNGKLTGSLAINSDAQAGYLQYAIWVLEGEKQLSSLGASDQSNVNAYLNAALSGTGAADMTALEADSGGKYGIGVLNLYSANPVVSGAPTVTIGGQTYYVVQDQLAVVPEATTIIAGLLLFLPLGASTLRILRRNRMT